MEEKYIELLLNKCLNINMSKSLFISYDKVNKDFVEKLINNAKKLGFNDIKVDEEDINITKDKLLNETIEEIEKDPYFDKSIWDEYAKKGSNFLMLETEFPGFLDEVSSDKLSKSKEISRNTRKLFREKETNYEIPWCIAAISNEYWAKDILGEVDNAYEKLQEIIYKMCMVDTKNPDKSWDIYLKESKEYADKLNKLEIEELYYKNSLGTNLKIGMPEKHIWVSAADTDKDMFVNMPSYEIFSSPNYSKTEGIVYSSRPLIYGGGTIDEFYLEFRDGKVVNFDAKEGKEILKGIIESDNNSCYLGEVALVNNNSPISNTGLVFKTTLFDENASCHLALGAGFSECIPNGLNMKKEELLEKGINQSTNHVDFMIGTKDLEIKAKTKNGIIEIFRDGNFVI